MSRVDLLLAGVLLGFAVRGFLRGFLREGSGFVGLIVGISAALELTPAMTARFAEQIPLPETARAAIVFIGLFMVCHTAANLFGLLLDRLVSRALFKSVNRLAGAAFGAGKGATFLAFVLLFFQLFPIVPAWDTKIMSSELGRPLVVFARTVIQDRYEKPVEVAPQPGDA
jgi:membrane protein required for colicin V production